MPFLDADGACACMSHKTTNSGAGSAASFVLPGATASYHPNLTVVPTRVVASLRFNIPASSIRGNGPSKLNNNNHNSE